VEVKASCVKKWLQLLLGIAKLSGSGASQGNELTTEPNVLLKHGQLGIDRLRQLRAADIANALFSAQPVSQFVINLAATPFFAYETLGCERIQLVLQKNQFANRGEIS